MNPCPLTPRGRTTLALADGPALCFLVDSDNRLLLCGHCAAPRPFVIGSSFVSHRLRNGRRNEAALEADVPRKYIFRRHIAWNGTWTLPLPLTPRCFESPPTVSHNFCLIYSSLVRFIRMLFGFLQMVGKCCGVRGTSQFPKWIHLKWDS